MQEPPDPDAPEPVDIDATRGPDPRDGSGAVEPTEPGTLRAVVEQWYADAAGYQRGELLAPAVRYDLNVRLFEAGFNPVVLNRRPGHTTYGSVDRSPAVVDHGNPEVRAIAGCIELLAACSPHGRHRVLAYLKAFISDEEAGGSPLQVVPRGRFNPDDEPF